MGQTPPKNKKFRKPLVGVDFTRARAGDIGMGNISGGDQISGIDPDTVLGLLEDALIDERQYRRLVLAAIQQLQKQHGDDMELCIRLLIGIIAIELGVLGFSVWILLLAL